MSSEVRAHVRPDRRLYVQCRGRWTPASAARARALAREHRRSTIASVDGEDASARSLLVEAGFVPMRREAVVVVDVATALAAFEGEPERTPSGIVIVSALDVREDLLRELDDELRQDVPGTVGWASSPAEFRAHTFEDPDFDPRTYLVALSEPSRELVGLVRIWMGSERTRLGMLGVRREWRRLGVGVALLHRALEAVRAAGATAVTTEFDVANDASRALAARLGARHIGTRVELRYEPEGSTRSAQREAVSHGS